MPLDPKFFIILRRALRLRPQHPAHFCIKHERAFPEHDGSRSKTALRAAQPNLHSGRLRSLLQVAAR